MSSSPGRWRVAAAIAGYGLLLLAWTFGNPPGAAPDEPAHYVKAIAVATGQVGAEVAPPAGAGRQAQFFAAVTRLVAVPAPLASLPQNCDAFRPAQPFRCPLPQPNAAAREVGTSAALYPPFMYLPEGAAMLRAGSILQALYVGRLIGAAVALVCLALGLLALWESRRGVVALAGAGLAVSPMVLFLATELGPTGAEIAGGFAAGAAIVALTRDLTRRLPFLALLVGAACLVLARPLGPVWAVLELGLVVVLGGAGTLRAAWHAHPRLGAAIVTVLAAAVAVQVYWRRAYPSPVGYGLADSLHYVVAAFIGLRRAPSQFLGVFGWLDTHLPWPAYAIWYAAAILAIAAGFVTGTRRQRLALLGVLAAAAAVYIAVGATETLPYGFGQAQSRYILPIVIAGPLVAADALARRPPRRLVLGLFAALCAGEQLLGWYWNARRYAVGAGGSRLFWLHAAWSPPGGWPLWLAAAAVGSALVFAALLPPEWCPPGDSNPEPTD